MADKKLYTRIMHKHDTEENWLKAVNFIPLNGELIIYDIDENNPSPRFKVGDGETVVSSLPFSAATGTGEGGSVLSVNGYTGEVVLTADDVGALTFDEDEILEDGVPIPVNAETFAGLTYDQFKEDMGLSIPDWALRLDPDDVPSAAEVVGMNAQLFNGMNYDRAKADILSETPVKSVNRKTGEIILNASDVGAATVGHTHTASDVGARPSSWLPSAADLNSIHVGSWDGNTLPQDIPIGISYSNTGAEANGFPVAYSLCISSKISVHRLFQICIAKTSGVTYVRSSTDETNWGEWRTLYGTGNKPTYSDVGAASATHGHSNLDTLWKRWNSQTNVNHCTDIDNPVYNGMYHCNDTGTAGSKPSDHGELLHITENPVWSEHQMYFPSSGKIYHRQRNNNGTANSKAWPSWERVMTSGCFSLSGTTLTITTT